ncbi:erythromycin esterase family protein [Rasiella rasia]|uniref:Erythromycin esterase family protein n=1 Tax=Rasiella rasia TaxID=2744027 RepID=A0A6G6GI63_9FLAO|nr:erythromycin esterase family protein [Rasiella rasia]QIE58232.1 erythromycin esterase family protein [Rasiella rasia]
MKIKLEFLVLAMLLIGMYAGNSQPYLKDSKDYIHPFGDTASKVLLNHIDSIADKSRIIGLGEVSHYTKECYEFKHQIVKKLIDKGYNALILEVDFGQALLWNDYVTNGIGNLDTLVAQSGWFTYRTQEFKNLLSEIRTHNIKATVPFQIIGMEMTAINHNLAWLANYFENGKGYEDISAQLKEKRTTVAFQTHTSEEVRSYWDLYYSLRNILTADKTTLVESSGNQNFQLAEQLTEIVRQYATYIAQDEFLLKVEFRDQFSTRNVFWSLNYLGEGSKIAIWAHNGHIVKESVLFQYDILGYYLSKWFEDAYYAIGFTFNEGEFGAFSSDGFKKWNLPPVTQNSLTKEFNEYNSPYLLFDLRSNLKDIHDTNHPFFSDIPIRTDVSESFNEQINPIMNINLSNSYDCMIYINKTHFPTTIKWKRD